MNQIVSPDATQKTNKGFQNLILVVTLLLVFLMASRTPLDSDLWWHLQSGKVMAETGKPLLTDVFSYTRDGQVWINHSWLGEVVLYGIYQLAGWVGISALMGLLAVLITGLLWVQIPGSVYSRAGFILFASIACAPLWTPRPQFFSLVFLVILTGLVSHWIKKGGRSIWLTLPLFILWANLHGGFMLGTLFLLTVATGLGLDAILLEQPEKSRMFRQAGIVLAATGGGYAAAAVNPNGYQIWLIPFQTVGVGILRQFIQEWASPDFHAVETWPFALFLIFLVFCVSRKETKTPFRQLIPALLFLLMALYARRNMAAAVVITLPMLVDAASELRIAEFFSRLIPRSFQDFLARYRTSRQAELPEIQKKVINLLFAGLLGFGCFIKLAAVTHPMLMEAYEKKYYPETAVQYLTTNTPLKDGRLFNAYNWGGYLVWKNPELKVFVDGRTDLFGDEILGEWLTITQAGDGWQKLIEKWNITRIIIEPDRPLVAALAANGWVERYRDSLAVVYDRKTN